MKPRKINFAFFGTSEFSRIVLDELKANGFIPSLVVTVEDKPKGRKLVLTPPETKVWAEKENIPFLQLKTLKTSESEKILRDFSPGGFDVFVVASYGKIIPQNILDIPKHKTLNVHPSLLPKLRGASPIQSAILSENETGISIMRLDSLMDHGPLVAQKKVVIDWPPYAEDLEQKLAIEGGKLLSEILPDWVDGKIPEKVQDENLVTVCEKIEKSDGQLDLSENAEKNLRKIMAYQNWPGAYFFDNGKRIIVKKARMENDTLLIEKVVPEGKKEMSYKDYLNGKK